jgi:heme A synthase
LLLVVPIALAVLHQAGALLLFGAALWTAQRLRSGRGGTSPG